MEPTRSKNYRSFIQGDIEDRLDDQRDEQLEEEAAAEKPLPSTEGPPPFLP